MKFFPFICLILSIVTCASPENQYKSVPVEVQYNLLLKIITYDYNKDFKKKNSITLGIIFQSNDRSSSKVKDQIINYAKKTCYKVENCTIKVEAIDISKENCPDLGHSKYDYVYIAPLKSNYINKITGETKLHHLITFSGVLKYVYQDVIITFRMNDNKPEIVFNQKAAKESGLSFCSQFLRMVKLI